MSAFYMPDEDAYWESIRERLENPLRHPWDEPLEPETDYLWLDDLAEDIETEYGCNMSEFYEGDLLDIVKRHTGIDAVSAAYDDNLFCIKYKYMAVA